MNPRLVLKSSPTMDRNLVHIKGNSKTCKKKVKVRIPQELIWDILLLLPVKHLCRFTCVSKSFLAIIESPSFANMQLHTCYENKLQQKLLFEERIRRDPKQTKLFICDIDGAHEEKFLIQNQQMKNYDDEGKIVYQPFMNYRPHGHCNGLFLLSDGFTNLILWNPSTRQHKFLPTCPLTGSCIDDYDKCRCGLGYDPLADDYKVALIFHVTGCEAWVFGLRSNSWRKINCEFSPKSDEHYLSTACFAHGSLHWLFNASELESDRSPSTQKIVALDVAEEKFSEVIQPVYPTEGYLTGLHILDGRLCIGFSSRKEQHLYVRKEYGDNYSWHKLFSITFRQVQVLDEDWNYHLKVVGYSRDRKKIMMDAGEFMLWYDLKRNVAEKIEITSGCGFGVQPVLFTESLVPIVGSSSQELGSC